MKNKKNQQINRRISRNDLIATSKSIFASLIDLSATNNFINYVHNIMCSVLLEYLQIDKKEIKQIEINYDCQYNTLLNTFKNTNKSINKVSPFVYKKLEIELKNELFIQIVPNVDIKKIEKKIYENELCIENLLVYSDLYYFDFSIKIDKIVNSLFDRLNIKKTELASFYQCEIESYNSKFNTGAIGELRSFKEFFREVLLSKESQEMSFSFKYKPQDVDYDFRLNKKRLNIKNELNLSIETIEDHKHFLEDMNLKLKYDKKFYYNTIYDAIYSFVYYNCGPIIKYLIGSSSNIEKYFKNFIKLYNMYTKNIDKFYSRKDIEILFKDYILK